MRYVLDWGSTRSASDVCCDFRRDLAPSLKPMRRCITVRAPRVIAVSVRSPVSEYICASSVCKSLAAHIFVRFKPLLRRACRANSWPRSSAASAQCSLSGRKLTRVSGPYQLQLGAARSTAPTASPSVDPIRRSMTAGATKGASASRNSREAGHDMRAHVTYRAWHRR
jgi:hypothetical protein